MTGAAIHAACTGCIEVVPVTADQVVSLLAVGVVMVVLFAGALTALARYAR